MRLHDWALNIIETDSVAAKLAVPPVELDDSSRGPAQRIEAPGRPQELRIVQAREAPVPPLEGLHDPEQKRRILHAFSNHELQAVELFAWALIAFPDSPDEFRRGLLRVLREEQMHTRLYLQRLEQLDTRLGEFPVSGYFWNKIRTVTKPIEFICAMNLTFENANLDHSSAYAAAARELGDEETAKLLDRIHDDEMGHVRFGWDWLARFKRAEESMTDAYETNVQWPLRSALARGAEFRADDRREIGMDDEFIAMLDRAKKK